MLSIYETIQQGEHTRSRLVQCFDVNEELSRDDLVQRSGLTYDQVRRQTKNLCVSGVICSRIGTNGKRIYRLHAGFMKKIGTCTVCVFLTWSVPLGMKFKVKPYVPSSSAMVSASR